MKRITENRRGLPLSILLLLAVIFPMTGCDDLLTVQDLDVTSETSFVDETAIPALEASVVEEYKDIYEDLILYTGLLGDEWVSSGTFGTRIEVDRRSVQTTNATVEGLFSNVSRARAIADFVDGRIATVDTAGEATDERALVRALGGLAVVHMAETYCEGTPMSRFIFEENRVEYGPALTRAQVLDSARVRFEGAMDLADAGSDQEYLAQIGLARVLLNEGDYAAAAAEVASIPTGWVYVAEHDAQSGQNNPIWSFNISQERWSVANGEGGNGLTYRAGMDPRMLWNRTGGTDRGFDRNTAQYDSWKYSDRPAQTVIADGIEARLIEAEAALAADNTGATMLPILNDLRQNVVTLMPPRNFNWVSLIDELGWATTLPDLGAPADFDAAVDMLFEERAYWLWLTAHRLSDMRRLIRQYGRDSESVFPTGVYFKGGAYGPDVNFPIPAPEANNPEQSAGECMNRNA